MNRTLTALFIMNFFGFPAKARPLCAGSPAPVLSALDQDGATINFGEVYSKGVTLVFFYPKADTPGCTAQACSLRDSFDALRAAGLQVLGVSRDTPGSQKKFRDKHRLPFPLITDSKGRVAAAFGVPVNLGFTSRQSFLIKDGSVVWNSLKAKTGEHAAEVQAALDSLK